MRVAQNTGWLFFDRVAVMAAALITGILIARYLGPERYGQLSYSVAFATLFTAIAPLGLNNIVVRDIVDAPGAKDETLGSAFWLQFAAGILAVCSAIVVTARVNPGDQHIQWMVGLVTASTLFTAFSAIDYWFQSKIQSRYAVLAKLAALIVIPLVKIGMIMAGAPVVWFAAAYTAEAALVALGLVITYHITGQSILRWRFRLAVAQRLLADSWPLLVSNLAIVVSMRIDQVLIGQILGDRPTGIYSVAARVSELWLFVPVVIVTSAFPLLVEARQRDETAFYRALAKLFRAILLIALGAAVSISVLAYWIVIVLYGADFLEAVPIVRIYVWSGLVSSWGVVWGRWIVIENRQKLVILSFATSAAANVVLNLVLIPRFGVIGAAVATVISTFSSVIVSIALYRPLVIVNTMRTAIWGERARRPGYE